MKFLRWDLPKVVRTIFFAFEEVLPAQYIVFESGKTEKSRYWQLESHVHEDSFPETVEKTDHGSLRML